MRTSAIDFVSAEKDERTAPPCFQQQTNFARLQLIQEISNVHAFVHASRMGFEGVSKKGEETGNFS